MKLRVMLKVPMAGDHGHYRADTVAHLPRHVARQVVLNGDGRLVDEAGGPVAHDFAPDDPAEVPPKPEPPKPAPAPTQAARNRGRRTKELAAVAEAAVEAAAEEMDPGEWENEE